MNFVAGELGGEGEFEFDYRTLSFILSIIPRIDQYYRTFLLWEGLAKVRHDYFPARESAIMM